MTSHPVAGVGTAQGWNSWSWPCIFLSLCSLRALHVVSPYGLVWVPLQHGSLRKVGLFTWQLTSPEASVQREQSGNAWHFHNLTLEVTYLQLYQALLLQAITKTHPASMREDLSLVRKSIKSHCQKSVVEEDVVVIFGKHNLPQPALRLSNSYSSHIQNKFRPSLKTLKTYSMIVLT